MTHSTIDKKPQELHCSKPDCKNSSGEFQFLGETPGQKGMTVVDKDAKVIYDSTTYYYKCLSCMTTFSSVIQPHGVKKIIHG